MRGARRWLKFNGSLPTVSAAEMGAQAINAPLARASVDPGEISKVIMGQVLTASVGQNPARQALVRADIPDQFPR